MPDELRETNAPRHALDCDLTPQVPDTALRARLAAFYQTNEGYARQQVSHPASYFDRLLSVMHAVLAEPTPQVLEIGSGSAGALHAFIRARPGATAIAMELSPVSLHAASENAPIGLRVLAGNALELPFRDRSVDAVVAFEVVEHLPDVARALDEMLRVVKRPGCVVIGLPNHASLWTPLQDALLRRDRRAFGVERGTGAWRWWRRNAGLVLRKRFSSRAEFLYREPVLDATQGGDADAVYYAAPVDLLRFFRSRGAKLITTSAGVRFGALGRMLPVEMQGSTVMAWRC